MQQAEMPTWPKDIGAITLFVEDLQRSKQFYGDVFDVPMVYEDANSAVFKFGAAMINLLSTTAAHGLIQPAPVAGRDAGSRLQLSIFVDDVDAVCKDLAGRGVDFINGPMDREWGMRTACFADPAGHIWEVAQELQ
jgi:catechol 2,3-dioxygenase-like lactoylglutathione lyase family enzyme